MLPALSNDGGAWVGWDGGHQGTPTRIDQLEMDLVPVHLSRKHAHDFYFGFANRTLWPLLHEIVEQPVFDRAWWTTYQEVTDVFASVGPIEGDNPPMVWVNDYHLMALPAALRKRHENLPIGFFLHTPFPAPDVFARLPWRTELLEGVLGADLIGFQTEIDRNNFLISCARYVPKVRYRSGKAFLPGGRIALAKPYPISIDAKGYAVAAIDPGVQRELNRLRNQFENRRVILGVDRLDYTKGILERLRAVEALMDRNPKLARELVFVQIAVPSRDDIKEYRDLRTAVEQEVGRINGRFTEPGHHVPVLYMYRSVSAQRMLAYYRLADVALVTPLRDGMNLVAKEFVVAQAAGGGSGVLILSEFAGAAKELTAAVTCNPYDVDGVAEQIEFALNLPEKDRVKRLGELARVVHDHDVHRWCSEFLTDLSDHTMGRFESRRSKVGPQARG